MGSKAERRTAILGEIHSRMVEFFSTGTPNPPIRGFGREVAANIALLTLVVGLFALWGWLGRDGQRYRAVIRNLHRIEIAKQTYARVHPGSIGQAPGTDALKPYLPHARWPAPVAGETYEINPIGTPATVRVGLRLRNRNGVAFESGAVLTNAN
jgi:hypothetical protein